MIRQIVVPAGGLATRLYPITKTMPKSMVLVGGEPFIAHQLRLFKKNGIENVVLCVGYLSNQIKDFVRDGKNYGLEVIYSQEKDRLDTGGAIKNAYRHLDDIFFVIYGDAYLLHPFEKVAEHHRRHGKLGTMCVWKNENRLEPSRVLLDGIYVKKYQKDPPPPDAVHMEYGLNILPKSIINDVKEDVFPISRYFDILSAKKHLVAHETAERFFEVGGFAGLEDTEKLFKKIVDEKK